MTSSSWSAGLFGLAVGCLLAMPAQAQIRRSNCTDLSQQINYVRERLTPSTTETSLAALYQKVKTWSDACQRMAPELWYYRSLLEKKLNADPAMLAMTMENVRDFSPVALGQPTDPFSSPLGRPASPYVRQKWALIVGVGKFTDQTVPALKYTGKDATDLSTLLRDPKVGRFPSENVRVLIDEQATLQAIRDGLGWLRENAQPDDLVLIYISSHGSPREMDKLGVSYVLTHDTDSRNKLYSTSYQMVDLVQVMSRDLAAQRVVLLMDTCHSGAATKPSSVLAGAKSLVAEAAESINPAFQNLRSALGRAVMVSSRAEETSWESDSLKNGIFTHCLMDGIQKDKGLGKLGEIYSGVAECVQSRVASERGQAVKQTPVFQSSPGGAEMVLGVPISQGTAN